MTIVLDANVLIAAIEPANVHHAAAMSILATTDDSLLIHPLTLAEVLVGGVAVGQGEQLRDAISAAGVQTASGDVFRPLELAKIRHATGLKMPDAIVVATAVSLQALLATFDDALTKRAQALGLSTRS